LTSAEKLETQKGIIKRRAVGQKPGRPVAPDLVLMTRATPTIADTPKDVSQSDWLKSM